MKKTIKNALLLGLVSLAIISCKKDEDSPSSTSITDENLNGVIKGKVTGFTNEDSTAFSFNYTHIYEEDWDESWWEYSNGGVAVAKTSASEDEVDIWVERYKDDDWSAYSYIWIENWDTKGDIEDADIEIYIEGYYPFNGKTLYYEQYLYEDDITVNSISFNKNTGKFSISLKGTVQEGDNDGTTGNSGTITMSFSGIVLSDNVITKRGK